MKTPAAKQIKVVWKKSAGGVSGYQIQTALDSKFKKSANIYTIKKAATTAKTIKPLKSKKIYFVRVRAFKTIGKTKYTGKWSAVSSIKCK